MKYILIALACLFWACNGKIKDRDSIKNIDQPITIHYLTVFKNSVSQNGTPGVGISISVRNNTNATIKRLGGKLTFNYNSKFVDYVDFTNMLNGKTIDPESSVIYTLDVPYKSSLGEFFKTEEIVKDSLIIDFTNENIDFQ